jgi:hypothetical protein
MLIMIFFTALKRMCISSLLILSVLLSSCNNPNMTDHSYTLEEYRELGIPDYDTVWNILDYESAFLVLNTRKYGLLILLKNMCIILIMWMLR